MTIVGLVLLLRKCRHWLPFNWFWSEIQLMHSSIIIGEYCACCQKALGASRVVSGNGRHNVIDAMQVEDGGFVVLIPVWWFAFYLVISIGQPNSAIFRIVAICGLMVVLSCYCAIPTCLLFTWTLFDWTMHTWKLFCWSHYYKLFAFFDTIICSCSLLINDSALLRCPLLLITHSSATFMISDALLSLLIVWLWPPLPIISFLTATVTLVKLYTCTNKFVKGI